MTHHMVELRDGRHIGVTGLGDPMAEELVLLCHPAPGAGGFDPDPPVTSTAGVRVITLDRPGYGSSDPTPDSPSPLTAWLDDVDEYLRSIERTATTIADTVFGRIGVVGWGVGAVYATGLAVRHPELINRLALVEPTGPMSARHGNADPNGDIDSRIEDLDTLDSFPGAADRMAFMLESARRGTRGLSLDRVAMSEAGWEDSLASIRARTVVISSKESDAKWYLHRLTGSRAFGDWSSPSATIVESWQTVMRFLTATR